MAATIGIIKSATEAVLGIGGVSLGVDAGGILMICPLSLSQVSIDNFTFKLFYKWSVSLFIASSVTVISGQFFGDPIHCDIVRHLNLTVFPPFLTPYCSSLETKSSTQTTLQTRIV